MKNKIKIITSITPDTIPYLLSPNMLTKIDEFYFGFLPKQWINVYGWEICVNRRPYPLIPHITDFKIAKKVIETIHKKNKNIYLAVNEHMYTKSQYKILIPTIKKFIKIGIDGLMIADPALIIYLKTHKINIPIHLSVGGGVYNNESIKFFRKLGIKRFILPRKLHIKEIKEIIKNSAKEIKFEIFLIGEWCKYNDAYCFNVHGYNKNEFCKINLESQNKSKNSFFTSHPVLAERLDYRWCGLCILAYFKNYYDRLIFKIPIRSDIFKKNLLIEKVIKIIEKEKITMPLIQKEMRCNKKFCAYEIP